MLKALHLDKRATGPWTNFESYLLKSENTHVGWIEWIDNGSFKLRKNPFCRNPPSPYTYLLPDEVHIPTEEGLIRVDVEKTVKNIKIPRNKTYGTYTDQFCIVERYEPLKPDELPKPYLTKDEFLYRLTNNWFGENTDIFSKEIAVNILSCPKSSYGIGGIGAQSLTPYGSKKDLINLNTSIKGQLPSDFLGKNKTYMYKPIRTINDAQSANYDFMIGVSDEISYNYLFSLSPQVERLMMPTQIPVIIPDAKYHPDKWGLDRDVFDYHMGALMFCPHIEETTQKILADIVQKTGKAMLRKSHLQSPLDNSGLIRLAKAWARLELKQSIDEDDFSKMKNDFKEIFTEYFDIIEDVKETGRTSHIPLTQIFDKSSLSIFANKIYKYIKQILRETESKRLSKNNIRIDVPRKEISDYDFDRGLKELVNAGYLLTFKNYTEFELV